MEFMETSNDTLWNEVLDLLPVGVSIHSKDRKILRSNKKFRELIGEENEGVLRGELCSGILCGENLCENNCLIPEALETMMTVRREIHIKSLNEYYVIVISPLKVDEEIYGVVHVILDETDKKVREHLIRKYGKRLGEILVEQGSVSKDLMEDLLRSKELYTQPIGQILLEKGMITPKQLVNALEEQKEARRLLFHEEEKDD